MVGMETFSGAAPSNIRDKIAFSPRVIVSRSNEADNDAPNADVARHASANRTKLRRAQTRRSMPVALRLVFSIIDISNRSFLTSQGPARKFHLRPDSGRRSIRKRSSLWLYRQVSGEFVRSKRGYNSLNPWTVQRRSLRQSGGPTCGTLLDFSCHTGNMLSLVFDQKLPVLAGRGSTLWNVLCKEARRWAAKVWNCSASMFLSF